MTRALGCGLLVSGALFAVLTVAFLYGIGPVEHLIDRDTIASW
ncbi:hypothetical protein M2272_005841 [Mycobacterium frederiksbergense]|uniref:Uncharacterized protein n=1 Tax=Mycolicibacterium frederiksbergense TaxID=117567 RepID=A0ABT6L8G8_9MYCO|nr:hypothetical protein [Mycolicibacterium frederiksbergense]MDH6199173.1 hypothetical protein [Mycolicibacterium frederiksbergense]